MNIENEHKIGEDNSYYTQLDAEWPGDVFKFNDEYYLQSDCIGTVVNLKSGRIIRIPDSGKETDLTMHSIVLKILLNVTPK